MSRADSDQEESVPLSEHEQRLLDQIERALYAEDPKFASTVRFTDLRTHRRRRIRRGGAAFVLGIALLVTGVALNEWLVGVGGFVVMLVSGLVVSRALQRKQPPNGPKPAETGERSRRGPRRPRGPRGLLKRIEERWQRRWDDTED